MYQYDAGWWCSEMGKLIEVAHGLFFSSCTSSLPASMCTYVLVITASWFFKNFASVSLSLSLLINDSSAKLSISHLKGVKLGCWTFCSFPLPGHRLTERSVQMLRLKHRSFIPVFDPVTLMTPPWPWDGVQLVLSESWSVPVGANETEEAINSAGQQLILLHMSQRAAQIYKHRLLSLTQRVSSFFFSFFSYHTDSTRGCNNVWIRSASWTFR